MSHPKRSKGKNFSDTEINRLLDILPKFINVIENKNTDGATVNEKKVSWLEVTKAFNANNASEQRSVIQLKTFYDNFKRKTRKDNAEEKGELYKPGGSTYKKIDSLGEKLNNMLKKLYEPDSNISDCASNYHDVLLSPKSSTHVIKNIYMMPSDVDDTNCSEYETNEDKFEIIEFSNENDNLPLNDSRNTFGKYVHTDLSKENEIDTTASEEEGNSNKVIGNEKKKRKHVTTVYGALEKLTNEKTLKKINEQEYFKLKIDYKRQYYKRMEEEATIRFALERSKLENEIVLQNIKIEQEKIKLEQMRNEMK